jgi:hypothetical protein
MLGEREFLRRIRTFVPEGAGVIALDVAEGDPLTLGGSCMRPVVVVLTDRALVLSTDTGTNQVVTLVPFERVRRVARVGGVLSLHYFDVKHHREDRAVKLSFWRHAKRHQFCQKVLRQLERWESAGGQTLRPPVGEGWVQDCDPSMADDISASGTARLTSWPDALVATFFDDNPFMAGQVRQRRTYPWDRSFAAHHIDHARGVIYLRFSEGTGLGVTFKPDDLDTWVQELAVRQFPDDPGLSSEEWRVRLA